MKINKLIWVIMLFPVVSVSQVLFSKDQPNDIKMVYKKEHNQQKEEAYNIQL